MNFHPRMRFVWLAQAFLVVLLLFLWALIIYMIFPSEGGIISGVPNRVLIVGAVIIIAAIILAVVAVGSELYYKNFEYDFTDDALVVRKGILARKEFIMPYKEIDAAKVLRSGVHSLDQAFGLTCIKVKAGSKFVILPGIAEPEVFLRRLMANVEGNEHIKNSEVYLSEREILIKLSADVRNLHSKFEQFVVEYKTSQTTQRPLREYPTEFIRSMDKDIDPLINLKMFDDRNDKGMKKQ